MTYPRCRQIGVERFHDHQGGMARALRGGGRPAPPAPSAGPVLLYDGPHLRQPGGGLRHVSRDGVHQGRSVQRGLFPAGEAGEKMVTLVRAATQLG